MCSIQNALVSRARYTLILISTFIISSLASSHGGGLDRHGCHVNRSTGEYHCHSAKIDTFGSKINGNGATWVPYDRRQWGSWKDSDNDCQNTRVEELIDHGKNVILDDSHCTILSGFWLDHFSDKTFTDSSELDIDHIVPLSWAHAHGASGWTSEQKQKFSNDPDNLLPVEDNLNQSKGDSSPLEWLPPNEMFHCEYLQLWQVILLKYPDLKFSQLDAMRFKALISLKCS